MKLGSLKNLVSLSIRTGGLIKENFLGKKKNIEKRWAPTSGMLEKGGILEFICENRQLEELNLDFT